MEGEDVRHEEPGAERGQRVAACGPARARSKIFTKKSPTQVVDRTGVLMGWILGASIAVVAFTVLLIPPADVGSHAAVPGGITAGAQGSGGAGGPPPARVGDEADHGGPPGGAGGADGLSLVQVFERSEPGVVQIDVRREVPNARGIGLGSGFVYDARGHIITNAHVVDDAREVVATFLDGRSYVAAVIGMDADTDLAVIRTDASRSALHPLPMGDSSRLKIGERVAAIGNPFGLSGSMTAGIVSQMGRLLPQVSGFSIPDIIQTDAAINPGNSGGPLINMRGEVVGINTAIQSPTGEFNGVGFAIPSDTVSKIVPVLISEGRYSHPWLGVTGVDIDPGYAGVLNLADARGFLIVSVLEDSPASRAGLQGASGIVEEDGRIYNVGGDVVLSADGKEVRKIDDILIHLQREKAVGDTIVLEVLRDGRVTDMSVTLEGRPG